MEERNKSYLYLSLPYHIQKMSQIFIDNFGQMKPQIKLESIPDLLFIDGVKTGPTALDGLRAFLHFNRTATATQQTTKSTKADKAMTIIIRGFIF